jgi:hypothetical protein
MNQEFETSGERMEITLLDNETLTRVTTKYMVGNLEWTGLAFQGTTLFVSAIYDPYSGNEKTIVLGIAIAHLLIMPVYYRGLGPMSLGGWWMIAYPLQAIFVNTLLAAMAKPDTYGHTITCVPGCNYSATMWLFLAYYPWLPPGLIRWRRPFELLMLAAYYGFFLILAWFNNHGLSSLILKSAGISFGWLVIAYIMGVAIAKMCFAAAEKQLEVQHQNFTEFFDFLHSHVKAGITAIRKELADPLRAREKLDELEDAVGEYRIDLLLAQEQVPLAALFSERIRTFTGVLQMIETPRLGQLTVPRPIGVLVGRALGDLLKNAAKYGGTAVSIRCDISDGEIRLTIADNGPGFSADILDDESHSLYRLRAAARDLGGDLTLRSPDAQTGAVVSLAVPYSSRKVATSVQKNANPTS